MFGIIAVYSVTTHMGIKYKVNENFFNNWNSEMAYVLGYLYADGSLEDASYLRGKYVRVTSIDRSTISKIKKWLDSEHTIFKGKSTWANGRDKYLLRIGSHKLYDSLVTKGLYPKKSLTIKFPDIPDKFMNDFIRGYFDGDGCVYIYKIRGKTIKIVVKKLSIIFTSGSREFLSKLGALLKNKLSLRNDLIYNSQRAYQLRYSTEDSIKIFKWLYKNVRKDVFLKRKFVIFRDYFKLRPLRIDKDIKNIIDLKLVA